MSAQLFKAISEIDPDLINACEFESIRHPHKKKWIAVSQSPVRMFFSEIRCNPHFRGCTVSSFRL